ncbi:hypothetical protein DM860_016733 [Cuscuta australis]|uniref:F-box domain-containing protein n=1 Tax=Cuscuta australis TaxID=267555 RepID=A0A328DAD7_9ASTE|nr:hypothetical protein DM860_016733 [Cuscuta australis]
MLQEKEKVTKLNDLDKDVLSHILSFLTLEQAIQTSILCKRWQYIWVPHPVLKLKQKRAQSSYGFLKFVQKIMTLRGSSKLVKFKLKTQLDSSSTIEYLISAAGKCDVEECGLHLKRKMKDLIFFPYALHTSTTLTYLEIKMTYQVRLIIHPSICLLPNLKTLKLRRVTFFEEQPTQNLFYGCLALEELRLEHCLWEGVTTMTIPSSNLHTLFIEEPLCDFSCDPKIADKFVIGGDSLRDFQYRDQIRSDQIRSNQIRSDQIRSDQIQSDHIRSNQFKSDPIRSDQIQSDQIRSNQIRSDPIRSDQIQSDEIRSDPIRSDQNLLESDQIRKNKLNGTEP